jgi:hypothetical protein
MTKQDELTAGLQAELARVNARIGCVNHDCDQCKAVQEPWVGLTKDDVESWDLPVNPTVFEFAQFIEAKLREKNGGAA